MNLYTANVILPDTLDPDDGPLNAIPLRRAGYTARYVAEAHGLVVTREAISIDAFLYDLEGMLGGGAYVDDYGPADTLDPALRLRTAEETL